MKIKLSKIRIDGGTQSRAGMSGPTVYEYADLMKEGVTFPDVIVFHDGEKYWLADGFHRVAAAIEAKLKTINADVRQGTQRDAVLYSVGANATHGLRRTNSDKRRAVETLLRDEEWAAWSDREIARRCGVDHKTVSRIRFEIGATGEIPQSIRRGGDGREINTAGIGANRHWAQSGSAEFWQRVDKRGLDKDTILEQLQPGAKALTDLTLTKQYTWERLDMMRWELLAKQFPYNTFVYHPATRRVAQVKAYQIHALEVYDHKRKQDDLWSVVGLRLATDDERTAYEKSEQPSHSFRVGDAVVIEGSAVVGSVTEIMNHTVRVTRPNPNGGSNMTHWVDASKVSKAPQPAAQQPPQVADTSMSNEYVRAAAALERLMVYAIGESPLYQDVLRDINTIENWFGVVRAWAEAEPQLSGVN